MTPHDPPLIWRWLRVLLALAALAGLAAWAAPSLAPGLPRWQAVALGLAGALLLGLAVTAAALVVARLNQWVLRRGGTDPAWLGLPDDPPGLQRPPHRGNNAE
jgi:hypothetical protein